MFLAHSCPICGQACYCDCDDTWMEDEYDEPLEECLHNCDAADLRDDDDVYLEDSCNS